MAESSSTPPSFSNGRRWTIGLNVLVSIGTAFALVLMANYLAARHAHRLQWTSENPNQLTPLTLRLLQGLTNQIHIVVFFDKQNVLYSSVSALLKEYQLACPRLHVQYVDYVRNPGTAQLIKDRYKTAFPGDEFTKNLVLFDCNGARKIVYEKELSGLDYVGILEGKKEIKRTKFNGELLFTSAVVNVTEAKRPKAYFLEGHREMNPQNDDTTGCSKLMLLLQQQNIQTGVLQLGSRDVPADCNLLLIAGPQTAFEPAELEKIDRYLDQGGRLLVLLNNIGRSGLETVLKDWGLRIGDDMVCETQANPKVAGGMSAELKIVVTNYPSPGHPITRPLLRSQLVLYSPRSISQQPAAKPDADGARVAELAASNENGLALLIDRDGRPYQDPLRERRGAIPVIAAVEKGSVQGISTDRGATRIVVAGDSLFLSNGLIDYLANSDFAGLAINWLLDRTQLMGGIAPRQVKEYRLVMTHRQILAVRWLLLGGLPGTVLLLGTLVWWRRRR